MQPLTPSAIGYIRVSTTGQALDGDSLDAQRDKLAKWAELNGYTLAAVYADEGMSGCRADNRPELQRALDHVCKVGGALVVYSLSRLARSTADTLTISKRLERAGADLVSLSERIDTTTAAGKMVFRMLAVLAEFERDQISERTSMVLQHKRTQGERVGTVPYGYSVAADGVRLVPNDAEQVVIAAVRGYHAAGLSLRAIAARLASEGYTNREGKTFGAQTISNILKAAA
jgi:DNA invertase Pin-like site-specific DNA recombinase